MRMMSISKKVSVILPTRNRAEYLRSSIDSIIGQTYSNWELIIVDGASTDNTSLVSKEYVEMDHRIRYHKSFPRQGLPRDRNIGISLSNGDYIFFIEDDLTLEPNCLEILVSTFDELISQGENVGAVTPRTIIPKKESAGYLKSIWNYIGNSKRKKINGPCYLDERTGIVYWNFQIDSKKIQETMDSQSWSLLDRQTLNKIGGFEEKAYRGTYIREEADLFFRLRNKGYKLYFQPKAIAYHTRADTGGCNVLSIRYYYYFVRNHIVFLIRNFGWRALYMIPAFLSFIIYNTFLSMVMLSLMGRNASDVNEI
jgi:glycosyltransferase involved in cell wall biosynthesis